MRLTIAYLTFRMHPRFEWFARSLAREFRSMPDVDPKDVQIVVIDGRLWHEDMHRRLGMLDAAENRVHFEHHPPKPSPWQGPNRQTSKDYFCAASVRNTAFAYAQAPHVAFVDDLSVFLPGWLKAHMHAAGHGYVLAGTTCKNRNIAVNAAGEITAFETFQPGQDSRLAMIRGGLTPISGSSLFGGTFSVPLGLALACNGQDEINDTIGGEDYDFGIRLQRAGGSIYLSDCGTFEDEDGHHAEAPMVRLDKPWAGPDGPYSSNFLLNKLLRETPRTWSIGNEFVLRDLRTQILAGGEFPPPRPDLRHWVDNQPLSEM
jgi:hypothetical protein